MRPSSISSAKRTCKALALGIISFAATVGVALADEIKLQDNAPDRYVVVKGDTLWGISGKFLKDPWKWPDIWKMNKEEIKNPHWIYPGDVIVLDMVNGDPQLRLLKNDQTDAMRAQDKLGPRVRITPYTGFAAPTIPTSAIEPFLSKPLVVDANEFKIAPRIGLGPDDRLVLTTGDRVYATGLDAGRGDSFQSYRSGKPLKDPDSGEVLGFEVTYTGDLTITDPGEFGEVATLLVNKSVQEIQVGDRLIPRPRREFIQYIPHAPKQELIGKIISSYGGVNDAGPYTTLVINRGESDGLELGHVLFVYKAARQMVKENRNEPTKFAPSTKVGNLFIYRVYNRLAYGLLLDSTVPVNVGDQVRQP